ncbi:hypothetical protein BHE74_00016057 [Ensete ventricosum]|nr:hypothetical protein GW17_00002307 [Ensete ventricosum]RWW75881.1 hypothetical protein BHE74_00016057 [Ensete ventricosum]
MYHNFCSWSFIDVKLWQPFLRSQRTKCNSFTVELQEFLAQQQRTFIQMRTNLKLVDNYGVKWVMYVQAVKGRRHHICIS